MTLHRLRVNVICHEWIKSKIAQMQFMKIYSYYN